MDGQIIDNKNAVCSVLSPTHLGIFEGIRAYAQGDIMSQSGNIAIFRWNDHVKRLWRSASVSSIEIPMSKEQLLDYVRDTVRSNNLKGNSYIQPRI